jgi:hypothetical protein
LSLDKQLPASPLPVQSTLDIPALIAEKVS